MFFFFRCAKIALRKRPLLFAAALIPVVVYLVYAGLDDVRYVMHQDVLAAPETPLATGKNALQAHSARELDQDPSLLFSKDYGLMALKEAMLTEPGVFPSRWEDWSAARQFNALRQLVVSTMTVTPLPGPTVGYRVAYAGNDRDLGRWLVTYYAERLTEMTRNGIELSSRYGRSARTAPSQGPSPAATAPAPPAYKPAELSGALAEAGTRTFFSQARILPAVVVLCLSLLAVLLVAGILLRFGPVLISERQAARRLDLDVWGSVPDLTRLPGLSAHDPPQRHG